MGWVAQTNNNGSGKQNFKERRIQMAVKTNTKAGDGSGSAVWGG